MVRMTLRRWRRLLLAVIVLLAVALAGAAASLTLWPLDAQNLTKPKAAAPVLQKSKTVARPAGDYAVIYQRSLLKPLDDEAKQVVQLALTLEATAVEPDSALALLKTKDGKSEWANIGQTVAGAEVTAIADGEVTLKFNGQSIVLKSKKEATRE